MGNTKNREKPFTNFSRLRSFFLKKSLGEFVATPKLGLALTLQQAAPPKVAKISARRFLNKIGGEL